MDSTWHAIWNRPLVLVLLAHTLFSIGIWNARDGYGEETNNVAGALRVWRTHQADPSAYVNLIALASRCLGDDPLAAVTLVKHLSSLLATVGLYLALSCFSSVLKRGAILCACWLWIASSFNAPFAQSTCLSLFTYGLILLGFAALLRRESVAMLAGFYVLGLLAASLRPEYFLPVLLLTVLGAGQIVWRWVGALAARYRLARGWAWGGALALCLLCGTWLAARPPAFLVRQAAGLDQYALFAFGQCYAEYYHRAHREEAFSPMTEYRTLLERRFGAPRGFVQAVRNNPGEALRYLAANAARNLFQSVPKALLGHYREQTDGPNRGWLYWAVRGLLLAGVVFGARRCYRARGALAGFWSCLPVRLATPGSLSRKLLFLTVLMAASSAAIVLVVGTPRYYLPCIPLFYLGIAFCLDSLLRALSLVRHEALVAGVAGLCLCGPNYLAPRPNYELESVRIAAARVVPRPVVAAWWAEPHVVLGLRGEAEARNVWDGIRQTDLTQGRIDILVVDSNLRSTRLWAEQREFFEHFERQPETFGFQKLDRTPGPVEIYYRPRGAESGSGPIAGR